MRKHTSLIILLTGLLFLTPQITQAAIEDAIVAIVNDEIITLNDLKDYIDSMIAQQRLEGASPEQLQELITQLEKHGLTRLIEDKIVLNAANKKDIQVDNQLVDRRLDGIRGQYRSEDDFLKALVDEGISLTDIRNKIRNQIKIKRVVDEEIRSKIYVSPLEVTEYFKNHFEDFQQQERINLDSIFVSSADSVSTAREKIEKAQAELKEGKNFREVAQKYSEAPPIGVLRKGQTLPEIENRVFHLTTGETTDIIQIENGFYIFQLLGRKPKEISELNEVKGDIYNTIFQQKFQKKLEEWIQKLKKDSFIDIKKHL